MKTCLKLSSGLLIVLLAACGNPYKKLQKVDQPVTSAMQYKPEFTKQLYRCVVNGKFFIKKFHLSGVLFFKKMEDQSTRIVFQNEMGFAFFDFSWDKNDSFQVKQIIPQLDKEPVIKILKKDMELLMMNRLDKRTEVVYKDDGELYHRFSLEKGYAWYIEKGSELKRIENSGEQKRVVTIYPGNRETKNSLPDSIFIKHHKAHFTIELKKIEQHVDE